jgi:hypothetical protein
MTILAGAHCEDGVILATDSVRFVSRSGWSFFRWPPTRTIEFQLTAEKIAWANPRVAYMSSGSGFSSSAFRVPQLTSGSTEETARSLFAALERSVAPQAEDAFWALAQKPESDDVQLLIGGGVAGDAPDLVFVGRRYLLAMGQPAEPMRLEHIPAGHWVFGGSMRGWIQQQPLASLRPRPGWRVEGTLQLLIAIAHAYVAYEFARFGGYKRLADFPGVQTGTGVFPPVAFPLHVAVITRDRALTYQQPELDPASGDEAIASLRRASLTAEIASPPTAAGRRARRARREAVPDGREDLSATRR